MKINKIIISSIVLLVVISGLWVNLSFAGGITIGSGASVTLSGSPTITTKDLTITGTLSAASGTVNLDGTWTRTGTFTPATSTVGIVGSGTATITGSNTFYNFLSTAAGKTINLTAAATQTITNNFTLTGATGNRINLRSTASGTQWNIDPQGTRSITYTDVKDSKNTNATGITLSNSVDSGNNTNWVFGNLVITSDPQTVTANSETGPFTVEVQNTNGNTTNSDVTVNLDSDSTGDFQFRATSGGPAVTSVTIPSGSTTMQFFYIDSVSGTPTITVSAGGYNSGTQQQAAAVGSFTVSASSPQVAGSNFTLTITAKNQGGSTATGFSGTVNLSVNYVSPATGSGTLGVTSVSSWTNGVATITTQNFSDCGTITITAADSSDSTRTGTSANIDFRPFDFALEASGLDAAASSGIDARHTVSKPFTLKVTARNASSTTCPNYKGNTNLTVTNVSPATGQGGTFATTSLTSSSWASGIANLTAQTYNKWGTIKIKAADAVSDTRTGTSANINFVPKDFSVSLSSPPASRTFYYTNEEFSATITAKDNDESAITNYQGTVSFSGSGLNLPADYTFSSSDSGARKFSALSGLSQTTTNVSVKDTAVTSVSGLAENVKIKSGTIKVISTSGPVGPVTVQVKILDSDGATISEDDSTNFTVSLSEFLADNESASSDTVDNAAAVSEGIANITITNTEAETVSVTPASSPSLTAESGLVRFGTVSGSGVGISSWREVQPQAPAAAGRPRPRVPGRGAAPGEEEEEE